MRHVVAVIVSALVLVGCAHRPGAKVVGATVLTGLACGGAAGGLTFLAKAPPADQEAQLGYDENRDTAKNRAMNVGIISAGVCAGTTAVLGTAFAMKGAADRAKVRDAENRLAQVNEADRRRQFESQQAAAILATEREFNARQRVVVPSPSVTAYEYQSQHEANIRAEERRLEERRQMLQLRRRAYLLRREEERLDEAETHELAEQDVRY